MEILLTDFNDDIINIIASHLENPVFGRHSPDVMACKLLFSYTCKYIRDIIVQLSNDIGIVGYPGAINMGIMDLLKQWPTVNMIRLNLVLAKIIKRRF